MKKIILLALIVTLVLNSCGDSANEQIALMEKAKQELAEAVNETEAQKELIQEDTEVVEDELFYSKDGNFKVNFSGTPTVSSDIVPTDAGDIEMASFLYEKSLTEAYMVAYNDYPSDLIKNSSSDDLLDGAKEGSSSKLGISVFDADENEEIEGYSGRYFKGNNGQYYVEYRLFLKGNRLYQIAIIRDGSYAVEERSKAFFDSFELVEE